MDRERLSSVLKEANAVQKNIEAVFKDKDLQTVMREGSNFKRELLAESVFNLKEMLATVIKSVESCGVTSTPTTCDYVKKKMIWKICWYISNSNNIWKCEKLIKRTWLSSNCWNWSSISTPEKTDHIIVVHGEVGDANFHGFKDNKWNTVVKRNLSSKLKSIPIKNSLKTKDLRSPQRLLFVENEETMNQIRGSVKRWL